MLRAVDLGDAPIPLALPGNSLHPCFWLRSAAASLGGCSAVVTASCKNRSRFWMSLEGYHLVSDFFCKSLWPSVSVCDVHRGRSGSFRFAKQQRFAALARSRLLTCADHQVHDARGR